MKFHCVADEDTVRGFRLAGVAGDAVDAAGAAAAAVQAAAAQPDCAVIIVTSPVADGIRPLLNQIRFERERPLLVEIAGPTGPTGPRKTLRQIVQEAVGIRLEPETTTN
jgi:V/A-type H+-transporting ATPase subunit F